MGAEETRFCQACLSATVVGKGIIGGPRRRPREPGQLSTQVASDKGARETPQAMGEGERSNSSRGKEGK